MFCPKCRSGNWVSVKKNREGVNVVVRCLDCNFSYTTKYSKFESPDETLKAMEDEFYND